MFTACRIPDFRPEPLQCDIFMQKRVTSHDAKSLHISALRRCVEPKRAELPCRAKGIRQGHSLHFSCRTKHVNYVLQGTLHVAQTPHRMRWAVRPQPRVKDLRPTPERTTRQQKQRRKGCWACAANKRPTKHQFHSRRKGKAIQDGHTSHLSFGFGLATTVRPLVGSVAPGLSIAVLSFFFFCCARLSVSPARSSAGG